MKQRAGMLVFLGAFMFGFVLPVGAVEVKIGVIDPQKILEGTKKGRKIKDMLADYVQARQRIMDIEQADLKKLQEEYLGQESVLSASAKEEKDQTFRRKLAASQRRAQELEEEVQAKKSEVLGEFTKAIEQAVQEIAEKEKIALILDKGGSSGAAPILYYQDSLDLTARVIKILDSKGSE